MSKPGVYLSLPSTFQLVPDNLPAVLPPPVSEGTLRSPFGINKDLYNFALRPEIPFTVAAVYVVSVFVLNAYNKSRENKPWWIAKQKPFQWFVVVHNVLLAAYSFATFFAMWNAIVHTWPGLSNPNGAAGIADALCKLHGPRGLGDATTFNTTINIWEVKNTAIHLGYDGNPDPTDVGRLWNEGLAFWGWLFYVSKFYEVLDTLIMIAKGKRSATLQTYHHAGAMLCMWAGIRYMSPPIWMFVFINSAIHAMMYTYFAATALGQKVPIGIKRTITTLQIAQFVFGASYAAAHLFVAYDIPISTPYEVVSTVERVVSKASEAATAATDAISEAFESPVATATLGAFIKKLLLRAAGEEGLAERVHDRRTGELTTPHMEEKIERFNERTIETRWRSDWTKVKCIDTSGEAFAIYLNLLYLAPLTWLFARFFIRAYTQRGKPRNASQAAKQIADSSKEGEEKTEEAVERAGKRAEDELQRLGPELAEKTKKEAHDLHEQLREDVKKLREGKYGDRPVSDRVASFERQVKDIAGKAQEKAADMAGKAKDTATDVVGKAKEKGKQMANGSGNGSGDSTPSKNENQKPSGRDSKPTQGTEGANDEDRPQNEGKKEQSGSRSEQKPESKQQGDESSKPQKDESRPQKDDGKPQKDDSKPQKNESKPQEDEPKPQKNEQPESEPKSESEPKPGNEEETSISGAKDKGNESTSKPGSDGKDSKPEKQPKNDQGSKPGQGKKDQAPQPGQPSSKEEQDLNPTQLKNEKGSMTQSQKGEKPGAKNDSSGSSNDKKNQPAGKSETSNKSDKKDDQPGPKKESSGKSDDQKAKPSEQTGSSGKSDKKDDQPAGSGAKNEPAEKQEENMADSQALRPGESGEADKEGEGKGGGAEKGNDKDDDEEDHGMGESGSIIDLAKERANEARESAGGNDGEDGKDKEDPTEGAEEAGAQWKPPGTSSN